MTGGAELFRAAGASDDAPNFAQLGQTANSVPSTRIVFVLGTSAPHISHIIRYWDRKAQ